jgi:DNA-binding beta-propeller fold protein YncE
MKTHKFILIGLSILALVLAACGSPAAPASTTSTPTAALGNNLIKDLVVATRSGNFHDPLDSTPNMAGTTIYFTATGPHGPGVFSVPAAGGTATEVFTGKPFVSPRGIVISPDDQHLYVTDSGAATGGELFLLAVSGGSPSPIHGSERTAPQNLDVAIQNGQPVIYFTGKDPSSGQAALLKLPASGANAPTILVKGSPLVAPDGLVVTHTGVIYLSDRAAAGGSDGSVFKVDGSKVTVIVAKLRTGNPAGISLTQDESTLLVSALQLNSPSDQVLLIDLGTGQIGSITEVIAQNQNAGGLHSAHHAILQTSSALEPGTAQLVFNSPQQEKTEFAWADLHAGGNGTVYRIELS